MKNAVDDSEVSISSSSQVCVHTALFKQSKCSDFFILVNLFSILLNALPTVAEVA